MILTKDEDLFLPYNSKTPVELTDHVYLSTRKKGRLFYFKSIGRQAEAEEVLLRSLPCNSHVAVESANSNVDAAG